jgi:hypothetical protein
VSVVPRGLGVQLEIPRIAHENFSSNAGGGGERVLWTAVSHIQHEHKDIICVVYSGDVDASKQEIIEKVKVR